MTPPSRKPETCKVSGCERPVYSRGWCRLHYKRWQRHGNTDDHRSGSPNPCKVHGCTKRSRADGMCQAHYYRIKRHGTVGKPLEIRGRPVELVICTWPRCGTEIYLALPDFWAHRIWPFHVPDHLARPE